MVSYSLLLILERLLLAHPCLTLVLRRLSALEDMDGCGYALMVRT